MTDREEQKWSAPEQPGEPNPDEAAVNAFVKYGIKAVDEHIKFQDGYLVPGFLGFVCDVDVYVGLYRFTLPNGVYLLKEGEDLNQALVYLLSFDKEELAHLSDGLEYEETIDEAGNVTRTILEPVNFTAHVSPVDTGDGRFLTYLEYVAWLAMNVAGSDEERDEIFNAAYKVTGEREITKKEDDTPKQDGGKPERRYDPITKWYQHFSDPRLYEELGLSFNVAGEAEKQKGREVLTAVSLEYVGEGDDLKLARPLSEFDRVVLNGVISQLAAGRTMFTATDVFEAVTGSSNPTPKQVADYTESLDKLRFTKVTVDMTDEAKAHRLVDPDTGEPWKSWKVETFMLNASKITMTAANGRKVEGYTVHKEPIAYTHARMTGQVLSYPMRYLDTKEAGSNTQQNILIRDYLLQRIIQAQGNKRMVPCVRYNTIYEKAGVDKENKTARKRANDYIEGLMKVWVKQGLISGYEIMRESRQIAKISFTFPE